MPPELLIIAAFATYRLTLLFTKEHGPADMFGWIRMKLGVKYDQYSNPVSTGALSEWILCPYCFSVAVGAVVTALVLLIPSIAYVILLPFALSGVSVFLFKWTGV